MTRTALLAAFATAALATVTAPAPAAASCVSCQADLCAAAGTSELTIARGAITASASAGYQVTVSDLVVVGSGSTAVGQTITVTDAAENAAVGDDVIVVIGGGHITARRFDGQTVACGFDATVKVALADYVSAQTASSCDAALDALVEDQPCDDTVGCSAGGGAGAWLGAGLLGLVGLARARRRR